MRITNFILIICKISLCKNCLNAHKKGDSIESIQYNFNAHVFFGHKYLQISIF